MVTGHFRLQRQMVADVLLDRSALVVAADCRMSEAAVGDLRLRAGDAACCDPFAKDRRQTAGTADRAVEIEQPFYDAARAARSDGR